MRRVPERSAGTQTDAVAAIRKRRREGSEGKGDEGVMRFALQPASSGATQRSDPDGAFTPPMGTAQEEWTSCRSATCAGRMARVEHCRVGGPRCGGIPPFAQILGGVPVAAARRCLGRIVRRGAGKTRSRRSAVAVTGGTDGEVLMAQMTADHEAVARS